MAGLATALAACSPGAGPQHVDPSAGWIDGSGTSTGRPKSPAPRRDERWDLAGQLQKLRPAAARARSEHLGGDQEGEVLASAGSGYPLHGPASVAPPGATLVDRLFPAGGTQPSTYLVMIKQPPGYDSVGGDWEYLVVTPDGHVEERGPLPLCARCHAEAPHDHLFGGGR
jgi:hypothetical protein